MLGKRQRKKTSKAAEGYTIPEKLKQESMCAENLNIIIIYVIFSMVHS